MLQPRDQQMIVAVRRCSRDLQNVLQGARLRIDRGCCDVDLISRVTADAFKRWREAYAELFSQLRLLASVAETGVSSSAEASTLPKFGRPELDARLSELQRLPEASDAADDLTETEACAGDFLDQLDENLSKLLSQSKADKSVPLLEEGRKLQPDRQLGSIVELTPKPTAKSPAAVNCRPIDFAHLLLLREAQDETEKSVTTGSAENGQQSQDRKSQLLLLVAHPLGLPAAALLSRLPSLAKACEFAGARLVICLFGRGCLSSASASSSSASSASLKPSKAVAALAATIFKLLDRDNNPAWKCVSVVSTNDDKLVKSAGFVSGLRRLWSPEAAQSFAQSMLTVQEDSSLSSSWQAALRQHLDPVPVDLDEGGVEICRHLGGAILLSTTSKDSLTVQRIHRCSDLTDLPDAAQWLLGNQKLSNRAADEPTDNLAAPDMTRLQLEPTSGMYYDPATGLYYCSSSRLFYRADTASYLFWDSQASRYWPVSDADRYAQWLAAWAASEAGVT